MTTITIEAVQDELARYGVVQAPVEGFTAREWAAEWKCSINVARNLIRKCLDCGLMANGEDFRRRPMDGRTQVFPVYRIIKVQQKPRTKRVKRKN